MPISPGYIPFHPNPSKPKYKPPVGVAFNDPLIPGSRGNVLDQGVLAVRNTPKKQYIRLVVWNYDAPWLTSELIQAKRRGAIVQVITAGVFATCNR